MTGAGSLGCWEGAGPGRNREQEGEALGKSGNRGAGTFITATVSRRGSSDAVTVPPPPGHRTHYAIQLLTQPLMLRHTGSQTLSRRAAETHRVTRPFIAIQLGSMLRELVLHPRLPNYLQGHTAVCPGMGTLHIHVNTVLMPLSFCCHCLVCIYICVCTCPCVCVKDQRTTSEVI